MQIHKHMHNMHRLHTTTETDTQIKHKIKHKSHMQHAKHKHTNQQLKPDIQIMHTCTQKFVVSIWVYVID